MRIYYALLNDFLSWSIYQRLTKIILEKQKVKIVFKVFVYLYIITIIIYFGGFVSKL